MYWVLNASVSNSTEYYVLHTREVILLTVQPAEVGYWERALVLIQYVTVRYGTRHQNSVDRFE